MADLQLYLYVDNNIEKTINVDQFEYTLGRLPECDLYLPYFGISRYHARISQTPDGAWFIEDLGSKNGTQLNGYSITAPQIIKQGDIIQLGSIHLRAILDNSLEFNKSDMETVATGMTIFRNVKDLQQQWIQADIAGDESSSKERSIARLKDLVDIAKGLNSAESIEAIFDQVQAVVFRYLNTIERLALLIDVDRNGQLELLNSAARHLDEPQALTSDGNWISRSICQKVFAEEIAIQTSDAQMDQRFQGEDSILIKDIHSVMAVPLWDEHEVVGVLYADGLISFGNSAQKSEEDLSFFSALANLVAASVQRWLLTRELRNEATIRQKLERYHSPSVVQQMMAAGSLENGRLFPKEAEITILFADIVGFTALSERLSPAEIAELLNSFFEEMLQEIFAVGGTLDKFIGDCIMAFFGAPETQEDHAERAVAAAKGMLERLEHLNAHNLLKERLQLRIAINSGKAVVGDVGSSQRVDYTVLGATINLASRMEGICPPGRFVVSETTYNLLRPTQRLELGEMGEYRFKGIDRPIKVYQNQKWGSL